MLLSMRCWRGCVQLCCTKGQKYQKQIMGSWILPNNECWGNFMYWKLPQRSFFGRIQDVIICFWDLLTFSTRHSMVLICIKDACQEDKFERKSHNLFIWICMRHAICVILTCIFCFSFFSPLTTPLMCSFVNVKPSVSSNKQTNNQSINQINIVVGKSSFQKTFQSIIHQSEFG